ncbi:putative transcriptional regulator [Thermobacillus composti KWC4]|uniref:Putative transcriptional regulator n=1 Tax=Thermobacillus composti (strain DSM 18247 / JCM 13945 / KWC4) TaxID=717605 RepID=L0EBS2_THECK|nr:helix-turn-helix domain-containing protein [Thermobacillus composti]AGA57242.1 putative transcriptional regulator [Thermobacillus composti KWC4]
MKIERDDSSKEKLNRILTTNLDEFIHIAKALSTDLRVEIFKALLGQPRNVVEISEMFGLPASTAAINIRKLEEAGLIQTEMVPGTRGTQKLCSAVYSRIVVDLTHVRSEPSESSVEVSLPIGQFVDSQVSAPCGILSEHSIIGEMDDPRAFFEPERIQAQLIWFRRGYLEYRFPNRVPRGAVTRHLELSMEICSEAPLHKRDWPSDITLWINGKEVGTWTSPGDFGGERGLLTPEWWGVENTQYGLLKTWRVNSEGSFIDGRHISGLTIDELALDDLPYLTVRIGIKPDAINDGGMNLFGRKFGNYETDLRLKLDYVRQNQNSGDDST